MNVIVILIKRVFTRRVLLYYRDRDVVGDIARGNDDCAAAGARTNRADTRTTTPPKRSRLDTRILYTVHPHEAPGQSA